jgi:hypothetical protein
MLPLAKLRFNEDSVEKRSPVAQNRPSDAPANVCRERITDYVNLLEIESVSHLQ